MPDGARFEVKGLNEIRAKLNNAASKIADLTQPFETIRDKWYEDNRNLIGNTQGPEPYEDYKRDKNGISLHAERKQRELGSEYPILVYTGEMSQALLTRGADGSVEILTKKELTLGIDGEGPEQYHQDGTTKMVARPVVLNGEQEGVFYDRFVQRIDSYRGIIEDFVSHTITQEFR